MIPYNDFKISFKNEHTIFEHIVKCEIKEYEFNCSYNPSLLQSVYDSGSGAYVKNGNGVILDFATGSFSPYITTVGLYNDSNELLAVAKMSKPLPLSRTTDMNLFVKYDL